MNLWTSHSFQPIRIFEEIKPNRDSRPGTCWASARLARAVLSWPMPPRGRGEKPVSTPKKPKSQAKGKSVAKKPKKEASDSGVSGDEGNQDHSHPGRGDVRAGANEDLLLTSTN